MQPEQYYKFRREATRPGWATQLPATSQHGRPVQSSGTWKVKPLPIGNGV